MDYNPWNNKVFIINFIKKDGNNLKYINNKFKEDKEVVLVAVKQNGYILYYADDSLKNDKEIVLEAINNNIFAYKYLNNGIISGKEFNEFFPTIQLRKKIKDNMIMNGFKYQFGLNIDTQPFCPSGTCQTGGLYCTTDKHINDFTDKIYGSKIWKVSIPDDAQVYIEGYNKLKADRLIINEV